MKFFTATYQKAEVLYQMGRFEEALVFYHTGSKQRPDMELFHQGVRKAQEAIEVSLGGLILKYKIVGLIWAYSLRLYFSQVTHNAAAAAATDYCDTKEKETWRIACQHDGDQITAT